MTPAALPTPMSEPGADARRIPGHGTAAPTLTHALAYGAFALPLAFAALPLYVQWPAHAASTWGMSLALLGALLLAVRVGDAFIDPWIGTQVDRLFARSARHAWWAAGGAAVCIAVGLTALMFAPTTVAAHPGALLAWAAAALVLTSLGYSVAMVTHQAWAVRLGGGAADQARWVGAREALALAGVIVASVLPSVAGWTVTVTVLALCLLLAWLALSRVPPPRDPGGPAIGGSSPGIHHLTPRAATAGAAARSPWREVGFRRLMPVVLASGLASAIPASLVVLYVRDLLQAGSAAEGWVLGLYFAAAAAAMPLWVRSVRRFGLLRPWFAGMCIAITAFAGAAALGPGDLALFAVICIASGLALGADLVVPPALLAGLIQRRRSTDGPPDTSRGAEAGVEGLWFGWWSFANKLTLALAAGLALPLVQWLGYRPGARDEGSLAALAICYALVPCGIKAVAALLLWLHRETWPWAAKANDIASPVAEVTRAVNAGPRAAELKETR